MHVTSHEQGVSDRIVAQGLGPKSPVLTRGRAIRGFGLFTHTHIPSTHVSMFPCRGGRDGRVCRGEGTRREMEGGRRQK